MRLPAVKTENRFKRQIQGFGGLNLTQSYSAGEMRDCSGISHRKFPAITQRQKSELAFSCQSPTSAAYGGKECIAADDGLYYDRKKVGDLSPGKKQLVILGTKIIVFPDKVYYDTKTEKFADLCGKCRTHETTVTFSTNSITVPSEKYEEKHEIEVSFFSKAAQLLTYSEVSVSSGKVIFSGHALKTASEMEEGTVFHEKCGENQYRIVRGVTYQEESETYEVRNELVTVENVMKGIFSGIKAGDVVQIEGCVLAANNKSASVVSVGANVLTFEDETFIEYKETANITIGRKIPDFTCVCSYENRLWGCEGNTVYASALGDAANFFVYKNLSTDSFTVTSNSAGDFTACVSYGNCCLFFKENSCFKLYGNRPSNFQLSESFSSGIMKEDNMSIVSTGGRVIYKGNGGVYVFYGGIPQRISDKLGSFSMNNAVGGSDGKYYYLSGDTENGREEFVWDIEKNLWSKSGVTDALGYFRSGADMYRLKNTGIERMCEETDDEAVWSITLCPFDEGYYNTKNYSRIHIRAQLFEGAHICAEIKSDGGEWRNVNTSYGDEKKYINIPCVVKGCHEVQLRLSGKGKSIIESIVREFSVN